MAELIVIFVLAALVGVTSGAVFTGVSIIRRRRSLQTVRPLLGVMSPQTAQDAVSAPNSLRKGK